MFDEDVTNDLMQTDGSVVVVDPKYLVKGKPADVSDTLVSRIFNRNWQ